MTTSRLQNAADSYTLERASATNYNTSVNLYTRTQSGQGARGFLYYGIPFPKGVTILSAKLKLVQKAAITGSPTNVVQRIGAGWSTAKITWANQPAVTGATVSLSKTNPAAGTLWEFDVTALMQTVSNGSAWYGFRINGTTSLLTTFHSAQAATVANRPVLEITWSDVPKAPTQLFPSSGRAVATNKPTVQCNFVDLSGDTTMAGIQVQVNSTDVWTSPTFDSGDVPTTVPELDLSTTAYAGIGAGATVYWRVRVKDGAGLWSNWSASTTMQFQSYGTLTLNNPAWAETFRNIAKNPRAATAASGWASSVAGGGTIGVTRVATGGPTSSDTFARATWSVASTASGSFLYHGALTAGTYAMAVVPGEVWSASFWARNSWGGTLVPRISFYTSGGALVSSVSGSSSTPAVNSWAEYKVENATVPATAAFAIVSYVHASGANPGVGATLDMTAVTYIKAATVPLPGYWDGSSTDTEEYDFSWSGTVEQSDSILKQPLVEEATPPISWSLTGRIQSAFEVQIHRIVKTVRVVNGLTVRTYMSRLIWTSGKTNGTATSITVPDKLLNTGGDTYRVVVKVWDTITREATPNFPIAVETSRVFVVTDTTATTANLTLTATLDANYPWATLNWTRAAMPDKWNIYRDGKLVTTLNGDEPFVSGTSYSYLDRKASPRSQNVWRVVPVVNGRGASGNPTASGTPKARTTLLVDPDGTYPVLIWSADKDVAVVDDGFVFEPSGNAPPVVIFGATQNGARGTVKGTIDASLQGLASSALMRAQFEALAELKGQKLYLTMVDETMEVFIVNPTIRPRVADGRTIFDVSFEFYQTDIS